MQLLILNPHDLDFLLSIFSVGSLLETQSLFSGKNKSISNHHLLKFLASMLNIKICRLENRANAILE